MDKSLSKKDIWIQDTQMFQRIAKVPESTYQELEIEWLKFNPARKKREIEHTKTHLAILKQASKTRKN